MGASLRPGVAARLGLTSLLPGQPCRALVWAILARLRQANLRPVPFLARACPYPYQALQRATGKCPRHLDSWSMTEDRCREVFSAAVSRPETGVLIDASEAGDCPACSKSDQPATNHRGPKSPQARNFETLCQWLDLPRLGLVDARRLQSCRHQRLPVSVDALLLDGVENLRHAIAVQTELETLWRIPVLGHLHLPPPVRSLVEEWTGDTPPSADLMGVLADHLSANWDEQQLGELMQRPAWPREFDIAQQIPAFGPKVRIAIAQDEAFGWCFPEVLDALERAGATLCDFSPLRSERLPERTDLVYIGCGHPERYAEELARNHCLLQSLRSYAAAGGRIYAEASGAAYLARQLILPDNTKVNLAGLLPINARYLPEPAAPERAEVTFGLGCWFADRNTTLRGYRASQWQLEPCGAMLTYAQDPRQRCDVLGRGNVICSRILFNVAAYPMLLERFIQPCLPISAALRTSG